MPVLQFKGKTAIECYHHTVLYHTLQGGKGRESFICIYKLY